MSYKITELTFLKYFAERYGIPVPGYIAGEAEIREIKKALEKWGGKAIVKPDVIATGRKKAGAIVEVKNIHDALREIKRISSLEIKGKMPRSAYLTEKISAEHEMYAAITYSTDSLSPAITISLKGGVDVESIPEEEKATIPIDIFAGLDAYQASDILVKLSCPKAVISPLSKVMVSFWDLFISTGMESAEINPLRITPDGKPYACDFKGVIDGANYKSKVPGVEFPEYPESFSELEEEMNTWDSASHQGQAYVSDLGGRKILPILFGGGASTIITETLVSAGGDPMFLSDFGGNPPYERMLGTARICFKHKLMDAKLLLILGGKANNTFIDVTFKAIADALISYAEEKGPVNIPVVIGRGGPKLVKGIVVIKQALEYLKMPYVIFGPDTPVTMVAEYAAELANAVENF
ncbi:MAG: hypothetical protein GXP33_04540 [Spirochaetes bacterium]|nr:hypothetical protein [Spirochaetota bacterium]